MKLPSLPKELYLAVSESPFLPKFNLLFSGGAVSGERGKLCNACLAHSLLRNEWGTHITARTQFDQIMRRAAGEAQERFVVDRRGEPQVVIMGVKDFLKTVAPEPEVLAAIRAAAKKNSKSKLRMREIDREVSAYRKERSLDYGKGKRSS